MVAHGSHPADSWPRSALVLPHWPRSALVLSADLGHKTSADLGPCPWPRSTLIFLSADFGFFPRPRPALIVGGYVDPNGREKKNRK